MVLLSTNKRGVLKTGGRKTFQNLENGGSEIEKRLTMFIRQRKNTKTGCHRT